MSIPWSFWLLAAGLCLLAFAFLAAPLVSKRHDGRPQKGLLIALAALLPMGAWLVYGVVGTPQALDPQAENQPTIEEAVVLLEERLKTEPDNLDGWLLLARSYRSVQRYGDAERAFRQAIRLDSENPTLQVELAEAMTFASGEPRFSEEARELLETAVAADGLQQKGLWLLGIDAAQRGADEEAIAYWERLLPLLDASGSVAESVNQLLTEARERAGTPSFELPISIRLADGLESPATGVLFLFAREPGSVGMPLAAVRLAGPQLPLDTSIGDQNRLSAGPTLASLDALEISARWSLSGDPIAKAEDLVSQPVIIYLRENTVNLELTLNASSTPAGDD